MENWGGYTPILDVSVPPPQFTTDCVAHFLGGSAPATPSQGQNQRPRDQAAHGRGVFTSLLCEGGAPKARGAQPQQVQSILA